MESPYYQKTVAVTDYQWNYDEQPSFTVDIEDTSARYHMYFIIRHTEAYPFSNIWLNIWTKKPGDSMFSKTRIEVPLAAKTGQWLGRGMGELWEQRMPLTRNDAPLIFEVPGEYQFRLEQNMRVNPLPEIIQVGLRLEKKGRKNEQH